MKKWKSAGILLLLLVGLTGCGKKTENPLVSKKTEDYERVSHSQAEVKRGDFPNTRKLSIGMEEISVEEYRFDEKSVTALQTKVGDNAFFLPEAHCYVKEGDHVSAGEVMVEITFQNSDKEMQELEKQIDMLALSIQHNRNLQEIDPTMDLSGQIQSDENAIRLARTKLEEMQTQKSGVSLTAKTEGTVSYLDKYLTEYGYFDTESTMVRVTSGSGKYTVITDDSYPFKTGQIFKAYAGENAYDFELVEIEEAAEGGRCLRFEPVSDVSALSDSQKLDLIVEKEPYRDVVYVSKKSIVTTEGVSRVYVIDENGYREAREVVCGDTIDDSVIITEGLEGGEVISVE